MSIRTTFNNHTIIPNIGLGLWRIKKQDEFLSAFREALEAGHRHFDTAQMYKNEHLLGEALRSSDIDSHG